MLSLPGRDVTALEDRTDRYTRTAALPLVVPVRVKPAGGRT